MARIFTDQKAGHRNSCLPQNNLRDESGALTKKFRHICWDGCMFPNKVMLKPETWNDILSAMAAVRNAHGWQETE